MIYLVSGCVFTVSLAVSILSCHYAPQYRERSGNSAASSMAVHDAGNGGLSRPLRIAALLSATICACIAVIVADSLAGVVEKARHMVAAQVLLSALFFDYRVRLIPNALTLTALLLGAVCSGASFILSWDVGMGELVRCFFSALLCFCAFFLMSRFTRDGMGIGDVKLIAVLAWLIGARAALYSVLFGMVACAVVSVVLVAVKKMNWNSCIPFAPFIFLGYVAMVLLTF